MTLKFRVYKEEWESTRDNFDNDGYVYGVSWYDHNDNFIDIRWFKKESEREQLYERLPKITASRFIVEGD